MASDDLVDYLEGSLDVLKKRGDELILRECLFCGRPGKMYVETAKLKFNCFSADCGARGSIIRLVMAIEDCDRSEAAAILIRLKVGKLRAVPPSELQELFKRFQAGNIEEDDAAVSIPLPESFEPCWDGKRWRVPTFLTSKRVRRSDIQRWGIGYCQRGYYGGRVIVPVRSAGLTSFVARDTTGTARKKYLNPGSALQGQLLFGYDDVPEGSAVVVVEGVFDAIALWRYGLPCVACFGSALRPEQKAMLARRRVSEVILMPDPDAVRAGAEEAWKLAPQFPLVKLAIIEGGDPDEVGVTAIEEAIANARAVTGPAAALEAMLSSIKDPWR